MSNKNKCPWTKNRKGSIYSLGRSLNFGQSSPIILNMISLLSMYNG
jgi:hypothetical protein